MRLVKGLVGCGLLALLLVGSVPASSGDHGSFNPRITLFYSGGFYSVGYTATKLTASGRTTGVSPLTAQFEWAYAWRGSFGDLQHATARRWQVELLFGSVDRRDDYGLPQGGGGNGFCTFLAKPRGYGINPSFDAPFQAGQGFDWRRGTADFDQPPPTGNTYGSRSVQLELKSGPFPCESAYGSGFFESDRRYPRVIREVFRFPLSKGGTKNISFLAPSPGPPGPDSFSVLRTRFTMRVGADPKKDARDDLVLAVKEAEAACLRRSLLASLLAGGPVPAYLRATQEMLDAALSAICLRAKVRIVIDYGIIERDPPVSELARARLPSCAPWQGQARAYCVRLSASLTTLLAAEDKVVSALKQLQVAASKLRAARRAGNSQAVKAAEARVDAVVISLWSTRAASSIAGGRVAGIVGAAGVRAKLTKAQSAQAIEALLKDLVRQGVPASALRKLAPSVLKPAPTDVLSELGGGLFATP